MKQRLVPNVSGTSEVRNTGHCSHIAFESTVTTSVPRMLISHFQLATYLNCISWLVRIYRFTLRMQNRFGETKRSNSARQEEPGSSCLLR